MFSNTTRYAFRPAVCTWIGVYLVACGVLAAAGTTAKLTSETRQLAALPDESLRRNHNTLLLAHFDAM